MAWIRNKDIENIVKSCPECPANRSRPPFRTVEWPVPSLPFGLIHIDRFFYENKIVLIAVYALTKYIECKIVPSTSVTDTIDALRLIFSRNGLCDMLVGDNASNFVFFVLMA